MKYLNISERDPAGSGRSPEMYGCTMLLVTLHYVTLISLDISLPHVDDILCEVTCTPLYFCSDLV